MARKEVEEEATMLVNKTSRLLSDDPFRYYGSRAQFSRRPLDEPDPEYVRREREALETIAHGMSEDVVDIFTILPESSEDANQDRSGSPEPETNGYKEDTRAQSIAYRSVKKAHINKISSPMSGGKHDWKDAKAALG
ncbi:MAG: hypothetical protein Q9180_005025 [Flavoplaca navasiana]